MDSVEAFKASDDIGWDVSEENIEELIPAVNMTPDVVLVITNYTMMLYNKNYVTVKVVKPKANGSPIE